MAAIRFYLLSRRQFSAHTKSSRSRIDKRGAGIAQWLEHRTRDWKVAGSNPCWNGGRIFFSRVDFLCWLLFRYPFHPRVTTVARKKSRSFCRKCRWQVTAKHAYTLRIEPCFGIGHNLSLICQMTSEDIKHQLNNNNIDKRTPRATGNTRYRYSKIAPLDHKMADHCVSLARTNTVSSTITKPVNMRNIKWSYSYSLLNRINKMYTHDLFYLQLTRVGSVASACQYEQIRTTKSQLTQCTKYKCY